MQHFKDLRGCSLFIPHNTFVFVEELRIFIASIYPHIDPYTIRVCSNGTFLDTFDKLVSDTEIYIWQKKNMDCDDKTYKVSDVFDALCQINGVSYGKIDEESSDSDDSFHSIPEVMGIFDG